jgi:hypothetical protein
MTVQLPTRSLSLRVHRRQSYRTSKSDGAAFPYQSWPPPSRLDSLLHPDRDCDRADTAALAAEIDDDPPALPELNGFDAQGGKFLPTQSAADQEGNDHVIALSLELRAIRLSFFLF